LDEKEELENLKKLLFKAVKGDDVMFADVLAAYLDGFCQIKHNNLCATLDNRFDKLEKLIMSNALERFNQIRDVNFNIESIKKELGMNGYSGKTTKLDKIESDHSTQEQWENR
jgi:hypothetical protein